MSKLRAFLIALTILAMASAPLFVPVLGTESSTSGRAYAAAASAPAGDNEDNDEDDGDNDDGDDGDDGDNDDGDNDDGDNDDSDNNDNDAADNDNEVAPPPPPAPPAPPAPIAAACTTPGQEITVQSIDGRIAVHVFNTMAQSVKFSIRHPIDPAAVPPAPGPVVGGLLFQLIAETCDGSPLAELPAEVNLGVRYTDAEAVGLNEANFALARLNTNLNQWESVVKQVTDPPANFTSATITVMGYYVTYQRP